MVNTFEKELREIARIIAGLMRHSEENDTTLDKQLEKVNVIFGDFNKKYPLITLKIDSTIDNIVIRILINESSVKNVFDSVASKLKGFTGIGKSSFNEATIQEGDKFASIAGNIGKSVFLTEYVCSSQLPSWVAFYLRIIKR